MNVLIKIVGFILLIGGIALVLKPDLIFPASAHPVGYATIEKRVKWGIVIGLGLFLIFFQQWGQWWLTVWALLALLTCGIIIARLFGLVMDGFFVKQIIWLLIEAIMAIGFGLLYQRINP